MFKLAIWNSWILSLLFCAFGVLFVTKNREIAKRMADMTGYTAREKFFTITASIVPYPFMFLTAWMPFTSFFPLLFLGIFFYIIGMALFAMSLKIILQTPHDALFSSGPYRFTRNPMYVAATIVFIGICFVTANMVLAIYLAVAVLLQHFMILAEERVCIEKYGEAFKSYMQRVPRYLFF